MTFVIMSSAPTSDLELGVSEGGLLGADFLAWPKIKRPRAGTRGANEVWALGIPQVWVFTPRQKTAPFFRAPLP
jgi:hypothetical protein